MKSYLIDASIVLKSILNEDASVSEKFQELLKKVVSGKTQISSQKFLITEVANGIRYGEKDKTAGTQYLKVFLELPIKYLTLSKNLHKIILEASYDIGTTVYDTSYHILAKAQGAIFLTCDENYYKKAKDIGDIELVK
ncbi:MAG: hypothetical protein US60_C0014G0003 [Microgenomates group bacterium GW2011_GWC1_37_8]|uniref:Uncharacterized protein n=1 Tax=Candidatus Woesebacteria bacterium GW2011_GWB1_38_8 TaxID=1618570 RepID=A0A0G0P4Z7_9BACT|nr:MAG: hypothetical protein US60_C0014G0003 [Microgenomates group bacterium GW2011_GWC1_37_8]KKQ84396.1 MAG: hypothetical protein UT08_C0018G0002 [Candidatus Woesebacteria bacterium GW2011_GWB1_38_8]